MKEEVDFQRAVEASAAEVPNVLPTIGPGSMLGKFDVVRVTPPAAAGTPPGGEAVESGSWATYNRKKHRTQSAYPSSHTIP